MADDEVLLVTIPFDAFPESYARLRQLQPCIKEILHYNAGPDNAAAVPAAAWARATIHLTHSLFAQSRAQAPRLKWVHAYSGGINQVLGSTALLADAAVHWTRNAGVHAPQIAEWAVAMLLAHFRQVPRLLAWQAEQAWRAPEYVTRGDLLGKTIAFYGYGAIARHTARIAAACGMRVVALTLHAKATPAQRASTTYTPPGTGDPDGALPVAWYHAGADGGLDACLDACLARTGRIDVLVVALPSTARTRGSLGAAQLARLPGCFVVNVGRGDIVRTDDLVAALNAGRLCGAALDVTDPEPLPPGHPLWTARNTLIAPHVSGVSDAYMPRTVDVLSANLDRLRDGRPLINQIRRADGY